MKLFAPHQKDVYKAGHKDQYQKGTELIYSNLTARSNKHSNVKDSKFVIFVGLQLFILDYLIDEWNESFFSKPIESVVGKYKRRLSEILGYDFDVKHIEDLHKLGYLPLEIKALPEGSRVPYKVPMLTIKNTKSEFYWVTNMIESVLSCELWPMITSATTYREYLKVFYEYANKTGSDESFVPFQAHDFSYRGMFGRHAAAKSALVSILCGSKGSDSISGIDLAEEYYFADSSKEFIAGSVNATEHSVMSSSIEYLVKEGYDRSTAEFEVIKRLITETYPKGIISIVSDTFDFWGVVTEILPKLKQTILDRDGKVVIRPDSGDPVKILCGDLDYIDYTNKFLNFSDVEVFLVDDKFEREDWESNDYYAGERVEIDLVDLEVFRFNGEYYEFKQTSVYNCWTSYGEGSCSLLNKNHTITKLERTPQQRGLIECLWEIFGGSINDKGFKVLNPKIGAIYGDSITLERQKEILEILFNKGFASSNVVLGVGSLSYQYVTRDTHGIAIKATYAEINSESIDIYKDPKTDDGIKKSAKGRLMVSYMDGKFELRDQVTYKEEMRGCLETVFEDGMIVRRTDITSIRNKIKEGILKELN